MSERDRERQKKRKEVGRERSDGGRVWLRFSRVIKKESSMTASNRPVFVRFETLHIFACTQTMQESLKRSSKSLF